MKVNLSIRKLDDESISKESRLTITHFEQYIEVDFTLLPHMLSKNYLYSPWAYYGNKRGRDTICSKSNIIVLDIDHTDIPMQECFNSLVDEGLSVITASTSNKNNVFKYRVLIPLNRPVDALEYRRLLIGLEENGLVDNIDKIATSAIIYAYKNSYTLLNEGETLIVDDYMSEEQTVIEYQIADTTDVELPDNFLQEFEYFTRASPGNRTKKLTHSAYKMIEMGLNATQITKGVLTLNKLMLVPKSPSEIQRRVINYILKENK